MDIDSDLLKTTLALSPQEIEAWLEQVSLGEPIEGKLFNWLLFAFGLASRARDERSPRTAHLAIRVYEGLAQREKESEAFSSMFSAMNLRAWMINELGTQAGHPVLDTEPIMEWFWKIALVSIDEARRISGEDWRAVPVEQLLTLRKIKNALSVLELMPQAGIVEKHPELDEWLRLRSRLP